MSNPFEVRGTITVRDSSTVLLARRRRKPNRTQSNLRLTMDDFGRSPFLQNFFDQNGELVFDGQWEVLMGQSEVINWWVAFNQFDVNGLLAVYILCRLRTTPNKFASMRYAGEWKLAGGNVDAGETIAHAAARELQEEFLEPLGFKLPKTAVLRPFTVKQTRAVRSRSNLMHCFIGLEKLHFAVPDNTHCSPKL